ncbi:MAG: hypothetical protein QOC85_2149, partial [Streptomyces sp.]|nr:hypothetical protein [Streptomyces sp.]
MLVICELLGVPYADHEFFQHNSKILINRDQPPEATLEAQRKLIDYLERQVAENLPTQWTTCCPSSAALSGSSATPRWGHLPADDAPRRLSP